jgi:hypothetical protein
METRPTRSNQILVCLSWAFAASALIPIIGFVGWFVLRRAVSSAACCFALSGLKITSPFLTGALKSA